MHKPRHWVNPADAARKPRVIIVGIRCDGCNTNFPFRFPYHIRVDEADIAHYRRPYLCRMCGGGATSIENIIATFANGERVRSA